MLFWLRRRRPRSRCSEVWLSTTPWRSSPSRAVSRLEGCDGRQRGFLAPPVDPHDGMGLLAPPTVIAVAGVQLPRWGLAHSFWGPRQLGVPSADPPSAIIVVGTYTPSTVHRSRQSRRILAAATQFSSVTDVTLLATYPVSPHTYPSQHTLVPLPT